MLTVWVLGKESGACGAPAAIVASIGRGGSANLEASLGLSFLQVLARADDAARDDLATRADERSG